MVANNSRLNKRKREIFENMIAGTVFIVVLVGIIGFFLYQNISTYQKRAALEGRLQDLQTQVQELTTQQQELETILEEAKTEEQVERALREQGLYKKEGEEVVTVLAAEEEQKGQVQEVGQETRVWWKPWTWFK